MYARPGSGRPWAGPLGGKAQSQPRDAAGALGLGRGLAIVRLNAVNGPTLPTLLTLLTLLMLGAVPPMHVKG
jgi:hypothetical protein